MATDNQQDQAQLVQKWLGHISAYDNVFKKWQGRVEKILKRYRDEMRSSTENGTAKFNILWSNVQTLTSATFAKLPKPDVSRRFRDNDPVGRVASLLLERALDYEVEHYPDYRAALKAVVSDRFLGGRGTAWVRYEPHTRAMQSDLPINGDQVTEDIDEPFEELDYECAPTDYVHWKDFGHVVARTWEEVPGVWRKVYMTKAQLVERFGEEMAAKIPMDASPETDNKKADEKQEGKQALIYEIWDKETKQALWLSKSLGQFVDIKDDPLELEEFFPCPKPIYATLTNDSLVPVPDFTLYQDQANELDILSDRIDGLIKALQVKGVYDASVPELARILTEGVNNTLIPVTNWQSFAEKQGVSGAIDLIDIKPIAEALLAAYQAMEQVKGQIYEITGISDIIRGQSNAAETATAQQLKGQYASLRLKTSQEDVSYFATDLIRKKAEIICTKFDVETLLKISAAEQLSQEDQALIPQAIELLKNNPLRSFRVEIAADSLVYMDEQQEKQDRLEFLNASSMFLEKAVQGAQAAPELTPLLIEMLKFGVQAFKVGKTLEGQFDAVAEQIKAAQQQKQANPQPSEDEVNAQRDIQLEQIRVQAKRETDMAIEQMRSQNAMQIEGMRLEMERWKAELDSATKIQVANISAQAKVNNAATQAAETEIEREVQ